jgi:large subunit ribosomal protein L15
MEALLNLKRNKGARQSKKRLGRGNGSGLGTYSGRGGKGQTARTGGNVKPGFAGGQTPLYRQMPKYRGFNNPNRVTYQVVNVGDLNCFDDGAEINAQTLLGKKLIGSLTGPVKILGNGELTKKLHVTAERLSASAREKIEQAKGSYTELTAPKPAPTAEKNN